MLQQHEGKIRRLRLPYPYMKMRRLITSAEILRLREEARRKGAMPIRVPLSLRSLAGPQKDARELETAALVNTGFEAERLECSLPVRAAEALGLWPELPAGALRMEVDTYGGKAIVHAIPDALVVKIGVASSLVREVTAWAVITQTDNEVVLSDALAEALGIVALKMKSGEWLLAGEPFDLPRASVSPRFF
ncbi:MAG: hypothetical protein HY720_31150 [Planctomycetes bacterium]|nr:hypothetical protein [Planctomycetota bacterium]